MKAVKMGGFVFPRGTHAVGTPGELLPFIHWNVRIYYLYLDIMVRGDYCIINHCYEMKYRILYLPGTLAGYKYNTEKTCWEQLSRDYLEMDWNYTLKDDLGLIHHFHETLTGHTWASHSSSKRMQGALWIYRFQNIFT